MKKIPTVWKKNYIDKHKYEMSDEFTSQETEEAFLYGEATLKMDGTACMVKDGELYCRYDAKGGKPIPEGAIPCCERDPETGHLPCWVKADSNPQAYKYQIEAFNHMCDYMYVPDGTYEALGPKIQKNPYNLEEHVLYLHGSTKLEVERTREAVIEFLKNLDGEGIVFWYKGEPVCKIRRKDFGFKWN